MRFIHSIPFYSIRSPLEDATNARARPSSHKSRHGGSACATLWRDMWLVARIEVLLRHCFGSASGLSLAMWAPKRDLCHFVGKTTKSPKEKKAFPSPVCVCGLSSDPLGTWHARELTSGSTNWAIFRSANGLKVLQLSPYIFGRSDSRAAIILAFYQPKCKGFSFGFPLKDLWPANCARILVSRLQYSRNGPWETRKMWKILIEYHIFNRKL